jgi:hypothetical protein
MTLRRTAGSRGTLPNDATSLAPSPCSCQTKVSAVRVKGRARFARSLATHEGALDACRADGTIGRQGDGAHQSVRRQLVGGCRVVSRGIGRAEKRSRVGTALAPARIPAWPRRGAPLNPSTARFGKGVERPRTCLQDSTYP